MSYSIIWHPWTINTFRFCESIAPLLLHSILSTVIEEGLKSCITRMGISTPLQELVGEWKELTSRALIENERHYSRKKLEAMSLAWFKYYLTPFIHVLIVYFQRPLTGALDHTRKQSNGASHSTLEQPLILATMCIFKPSILSYKHSHLWFQLTGPQRKMRVWQVPQLKMTKFAVSTVLCLFVFAPVSAERFSPCLTRYLFTTLTYIATNISSQSPLLYFQSIVIPSQSLFPRPLAFSANPHFLINKNWHS